MIKGKLVNIKRLIVKTENTIKENNGELKGMELVRCHSNISMMKQYLDEIKQENDNNEVDATTICEISNKIDKLSLLIDQDKLKFATAKKNYSKGQKVNFGNSSIDESFEYLIQRKAEKRIKSELFEVPEPLKEEKYNVPTAEDLRNDLLSTSNSSSNTRQRSLYKNTEDEDENVDGDEVKSLIDNHKKIQEGYTDDLVKLAASLKANSLAFTDLLKKDEKVREEADTLLQENVSHVQREGKKLKSLLKSTRSTKWFIYLILLIVFVLFVFTILFIRIFPVQKRY